MFGYVYEIVQCVLHVQHRCILDRGGGNTKVIQGGVLGYNRFAEVIELAH